MIVLESMCTHMNGKTFPSPHVQTHETQLMPSTEVVQSSFKACGSGISNTKMIKYSLATCDICNFNQQLNLFVYTLVR